MNNKLKTFLSLFFVLALGFVLIACTPKKFTVTFDTDGGTAIAAVEVTKDEKVSRPTDPTKDGFDFNEWQLDGERFDFETPITADITLKATWSAVEITAVEVTFTVTLPADTPAGDIFLAGDLKHADLQAWGDEHTIKATRTGSTATFKVTYDAEDLPVEIAYKWTRGNWATVEKGAEGEELDNRTATITADNATFAISNVVESWADVNEANAQYTVQFNSDGGSIVDDILVKNGGKATKPADPTKSEHIFKGWQLDGVDFDFDTPITKNITLKAVWEVVIIEYIQVTFETNGGSLIDPIDVAEGTALTLPPAPTKEFGAFAGWFTDVELNTAFVPSTLLNDDIKLYAKWDDVDEMNVVLSYPGGPDSSFTKNMTDGNNAEIVGLNPGVFTVSSTPRQLNLPSPLHIGLNQGGNIRIYATTAEVGKSTLAVQIGTGLVITKVEFKFVGSTNTPNGTLTLGSVTSTLTEADLVNTIKTYEDLSVDGFSLRAVQKTGVSSNAQIWIESIAITYEKGTATSTFTPIPLIDVTYDLNFAESTAIVQNYESGDKLALPSEPKREGFNFEGWFTDAATTTEFDATAVTVTAPLTVYAKWSAQSDEGLLAEAEDALELDTLLFEEAGTILLPEKGLHDVDIAWASNNALINAETGAVSLPTEPGLVKVTLTATLTLGSETPLTKTFEVSIFLADPEDEGFLKIFQVLATEKDTAVKFRGVVTGFTAYDSGNTRYEKVWLEDETGAITVYRGSFAPDLAIGDKYVVEGNRTDFSSLNQIGAGSTLTLVSKENPISDATDITDLDTLTTAHQAMRINITGAEVVSINTNGQQLVIKVGTENITVRALSGSGTINDHMKTAIVGQIVNIVGINVDWYNTAQLLPTLVSQVVFVPLTDAQKVALAAEDIVDSFDGKTFNMGTDIELPLIGLQGTTVEWASTTAISDNKWAEVTEDSEVTLTATVKSGTVEEVVSVDVTVKFIEPGTPEETIILHSDFGKTNSSDTNYGTEFNDTVSNGELDSNPSGTTSWQRKGGNYNNEGWDHIRFGQKNVAATLADANVFLATNFKLNNINSVEIDFQSLKADTTIHIQTSLDGTTWTDLKTYTNTSNLTNDTVIFNELNVSVECHFRIVFVNSSSTSSNGWLAHMTTITFNGYSN